MGAQIPLTRAESQGRARAVPSVCGVVYSLKALGKRKRERWLISMGDATTHPVISTGCGSREGTQAGGIHHSCLGHPGF